MKQTMVSRVMAYLAHRRALGFKLLIEGRLLLNFGRFADRCRHRGPLSLHIALRWSTLPQSSDRLYQARRLEVIRTFAKHLALVEPRTVVPPRHLLGPAHRRAEPYIYSELQIRQLMSRAIRLSGTIRPHTLQTLIGLLACAGLRISEALKLKLTDVDLDTGVLTIRESKYQKTRFVPLDRSVITHLSAYSRRRQKLFPLAEFFFVSQQGAGLPAAAARRAFSQLRKGLPSARRAPRFHDLRHTFTCRVLVRWQRSARGAAYRVPILSRYLGHAHVTDTYWYLTSLPELMTEVAKRFEQFRDEDH